MKKEIIAKGKFVDFVSFNGYEVLDENKTLVMVIPTITKKQKDGDSDIKLYGFRHEYCPPYMYYDKKERNWYTVISGGVEKGEAIIDACLRELREEAGLIVDNFKSIDVKFVNKKVPLCKSTTLRADILAIDLTKSKISWETASGDGTEFEQKSSTIWLTKEELEEMIINENCDLLMNYFAAVIETWDL